MENYRVGVDEGNDLDSIDFDALIKNLEVCICFSFTLPFLNCQSGHPLNGPDVFARLILTKPLNFMLCFLAFSSFICYICKDLHS